MRDVAGDGVRVSGDSRLSDLDFAGLTGLTSPGRYYTQLVHHKRGLPSGGWGSGIP